MKVLSIVIVALLLVVTSFLAFDRTPILRAQMTVSQNDAAESMARRPPSVTRKPTQTRIPTRRPSHTQVPTRKPSHTHVATKTRTRINTRVPTLTHTQIPTTTPSTVPTATATATPVALSPTDTVEFVNVSASDWRVSVNSVSIGIEPTLQLQKGETYTFGVNAGSFHPLMLSTDGTTANEYTDGVSPTGGSTTSITFVVSSSAPATLYYVCANHSSMRGRIVVVEP